MLLDSLSVKLPVSFSKPAERWLVFTSQPMMKVDQSVVTFNILVQCFLKVPAQKWKRNTEVIIIEPVAPEKLPMLMPALQPPIRRRIRSHQPKCQNTLCSRA